MKKCILLSLVLIAMACNAQTFQGTITWSMKYDITDPVEKAKMDKAQKEMSDPANQEKMKKMQEQMNSPEMKKMMESNPQMKARMEAAMAMMQGGGGMGIMNNTFIVQTDGKNTLTKTAGIVSIEMLYLGDKSQAYMINRAAKTYSISNTGDAAKRSDSLVHKVTKTSETMKVLNYNCTKTIVELTTKSGTTITENIWTTTEIKGYDMKAMARQKMGNASQNFFTDDITGAPLRIEMVTAKVKTIMEVTDIKKETIPASAFVIPADFTETKGFLGM